MKTWQANWISDLPFQELAKPNMYHKELEAVSETIVHQDDLKNHHWLARKVCNLADADLKNSKVYLDITADDYYKLYINGRYVAQGPAQNDAAHYYYNRLEVGSFLQPGSNIIAVHVYYQGLVNRAFNSGDYRQGMMAELITNDRIIVKTDESWRVRRAEEFIHIGEIGYSTQFIEKLDARKSQRGWKELAFNDDHWLEAQVEKKLDYTFVAQPTPVLSVYNKRPSVVKKLGAGHYFIDFGQEITGQFIMSAQGTAGTEIEIRYGEELEADQQSVRFHMRCNCIYQEYWILSGNDDLFETFDYKGFRYVEVIGAEEAIQEATFQAIVRHYPFQDNNCVIESSDELLNGIFTICKNGVKFGAQDHFVDCPTREKGQYLGDNTVIGHAHMLLSNDLRLYKKAIEQFAYSSKLCPGLMAVVPGHFMQEIADYSLQWPMQLLEYYRYSGDIVFLKEMYPHAERLLLHFQSYDRGDGLLHEIEGKWNLVDWPSELRDNYDFELTKPIGAGCHNVINAFYLGAMQSLNEIRDIIGVSYQNELPRLQKRFVEVFYDAKQRLFVDAESSSHHALHSNVLPLLFGCAPQEAVPEIVEFIRRKGFACGVYFSYFVLKSLAKVGEYDLLYDMILSEGEHSWANMLREGATTCFEAWGKDQKWNTSLCHPWASAPVPLLIEEIIGLKPAKPGWQEILFSPHVPARLQQFTLQIKVSSGDIRLSYDHGRWSEQFPPGVPVKRME